MRKASGKKIGAMEPHRTPLSIITFTAILIAVPCSYGLEIDPSGNIEYTDLPQEIRISSPTNLPAGTEVTVHIAGPQEFAESRVANIEDDRFEAVITADTDWPVGQYEVRVRGERLHIESFRIWSLETPGANTAGPDPGQLDEITAGGTPPVDPARDPVQDPIRGPDTSGTGQPSAPPDILDYTYMGLIFVMVVAAIPAVIAVKIIKRIHNNKKYNICNKCGMPANPKNGDSIRFRIMNYRVTNNYKRPRALNENMSILLHHKCLANDIWKVDDYVRETQNYLYTEVYSRPSEKNLMYRTGIGMDGNWYVRDTYFDRNGVKKYDKGLDNVIRRVRTGDIVLVRFKYGDHLSNPVALPMDSPILTQYVNDAKYKEARKVAYTQHEEELEELGRISRKDKSMFPVWNAYMRLMFNLGFMQN